MCYSAVMKMVLSTRMTVLLTALATVAILISSGCGLIPKKVEFFQSKVKPVPAKTTATAEKERQAADFLNRTVSTAYTEAVRDNYTNSSVMNPLLAAKVVAPALSYSLGPPEKPLEDVSVLAAERLALSVNKELAKLNDKIEDYRRDVKPLEGKKIEGTGLIQVPYFVYLGGLLVVGMIIWFILKIVAMSNPAVAIGMKTAQIGGSLLSKGFGELIEGGEKFKEKIKTAAKEQFSKEEVIELFRTSHGVKQSREIQDLVDTLTKK